MKLLGWPEIQVKMSFFQVLIEFFAIFPFFVKFLYWVFDLGWFQSVEGVYKLEFFYCIFLMYMN